MTSRSIPRTSADAPAPVQADRLAVLAVRAAAQGLDRTASAARDLDLLALGVQDSPPGAARLSLAARTAAAGGPEPARWEGDPGLRSAWSVRGAPHVHRRADLPALAAALWPHDDADAAARLAWNAARIAASGLPPLRALELATAAVREVAALDPATLDTTGLQPVERPDGEVGLSKGLLSREVTRRVPPELRRWCEPCQVEHLSEQLLRLAALPGGLAVERTAPLVFGPYPGAPARLDRGGDVGPLVRDYLRLYPPATPADVKAFLGCTLDVVTAHWPADAVPVEVAPGPGARTRRAWALPAGAAALADPPEPPAVRLLPPNDAFLKAGDRDVVVPDRVQQKAIWRVLGGPGVLLLDAVPTGVWRARAAGGRLEVTVDPFVPLPPAARAGLAEEAGRMAGVRGLALGPVRS